MIPLHINFNGKEIVVVGGGEIAYRRLCLFLEEKAKITVISPAVLKEIEELHNQKKLKWIKKKVEIEDFNKAFLIIAATNDSDINEWVSTNSRENQLINNVSLADKGNVTVPKTVNKGKLVLSISTGGASPSLSKQISEQLISQFDDQFIEELDRLYEERLLKKKKKKV